MHVPDDLVAALRALLVGDHAEHERLIEPYAQSQHAGYVLLIIGAFHEVVQRRFGEQRLHSDIVRYVGQVRTRDGFDDLDPLTAEKVIRSALGDTEATTDIDPATVGITQLDLLPALVRDQQLDDNQLDEFLATARQHAENIRIDS